MLSCRNPFGLLDKQCDEQNESQKVHVHVQSHAKCEKHEIFSQI